MGRMNTITTGLAILLCACILAGKCAMARTLHGYGVQVPPFDVNNPQWAALHIQKRCKRELAEIQKQFRESQLHSSWKPTKEEGKNIDSTAVRLKPRGSHRSFTHSLPSDLQQSHSLCLNNNLPARYMTELSPKVSPESATDPLEVPIYIPREFIFSPPPSPSKINLEKKENAKNVSAIVALAASVSGVVVIFALAVFCYFTKGSSRHELRDVNHFLTGNTSIEEAPGSSGVAQENQDLGRSKSSKLSFLRSKSKHASNSGPIQARGPATPIKLEAQPSQKRTSPRKSKPAPPPPPAPGPLPPKAKPQPPPPPKVNKPPPAPPGMHRRRRSASCDGSERSSDHEVRRAKLKPFFWDKVVGSADHSMVWDEVRRGSFQFNEEVMESLFSYSNDDKKNFERRSTRVQDACNSSAQYVRIINPKKSQNLSILLKALNVTTEEVRDAVLQGNRLPTELLQTLMRMAPTPDEELKLRCFDGDLTQLGPVEQFLKVLVDIPFVFKRMESLMFMMTFKEEASGIKESFVILEVACEELKKSRLFLKLLEAVLKTGNRMNDGTYRGGAQAFKLDTLLKLADVKGTDGKTTLLHFLVQEIIRSEGMKALRAMKENPDIPSTSSGKAIEDPSIEEEEQEEEDYRTLGLQVVSSISSELEHVKRAAVIDAEGLTSTVSKLGHSLLKIKDFLKNDMQTVDEESGFYESISSFVANSEGEMKWMVEEERRISELVRKTADYFHGNAGKEEGLRLFTIVRDFLVMLDKICAELKRSYAKPKETLTPSSSSHHQQQCMKKMRQQLFPAIADRHVDDSSSNDEESDHENNHNKGNVVSHSRS